MFSDHLDCDSVPLAFSLGSAPGSLPECAPRSAHVRLNIVECAQFKSSDLLRGWQQYSQVSDREFAHFLASPFDPRKQEDHELAHTMLSDLFLALVGNSLAECARVEICSLEKYIQMIKIHEPNPFRHEELATTDGCFVGGYLILVKGVRGRVDTVGIPKSWSSIMRCALHEIGHRVFWPTEENYIGSELAAEYFAYCAWNRLRQEVLPTGDDIGICKASGDANYRRISLAAQHLVGLSALTCSQGYF